MRIRSIKPEFWRSADITGLSLEDRLLFIGLWSYVDDNGVGRDELPVIVADLFAGDMFADSRETVARVSRGLSNLFTACLIDRYSVDGKAYLMICKWDKHQRIDKPAKERFPRSDGTLEVIRETVGTPSRDSRDTLAPGTGEQGNKGTGEQGNKGTGEQGSRGAETSALVVPDLFDAFWSLWPRKEGKADAVKAWAKAIRKIDQTLLLELARTYVQHPNRPAKQFVPHGATWLNGERWNDGEPTAAESRSGYQTNTEQNMAYLRSLAEQEQPARFEIEGAA